jgi:hypothetical protein
MEKTAASAGPTEEPRRRTRSSNTPAQREHTLDASTGIGEEEKKTKTMKRKGTNRKKRNLQDV